MSSTYWIFARTDMNEYNLSLTILMVTILVVLIVTKNTNKHYNKIVLSCIVAQTLRYQFRLFDFEGNTRKIVIKDNWAYVGFGWLFLTNILTLLTFCNFFVIHNNFKYTKFKTLA